MDSKNLKPIISDETWSKFTKEEKSEIIMMYHAAQDKVDFFAKQKDYRYSCEVNLLETMFGDNLVKDQEICWS